MITVKFYGVDYWSRPVFKEVRDDGKDRFYGSVDILCDYEDSVDDIIKKIPPESLTYFGNSFDCEPLGAPVKDTIKIIK